MEEYASDGRLYRLGFQQQLDVAFAAVTGVENKQLERFTGDMLHRLKVNHLEYLSTLLEPLTHRGYMYSFMDAFPVADYKTPSTFVTRECMGSIRKQLDRQKDDLLRWNSTFSFPAIEDKRTPSVPGNRRSRCNNEERKLRLNSKQGSHVTSSSRSRSTKERLVASAPDHRSRGRVCVPLPACMEVAKRHMQKPNGVTLFHGQHPGRACWMESGNPTSATSSLPECRKTENRQGKGKKEKTRKEILVWIAETWNDWQIKQFLDLYIHLLTSACSLSLYGMLTIRLKKDVVTLLPKNISLMVLHYFKPKELTKLAKVCRTWQSRCEDDTLWKNHCRTIDKYFPHTPGVSWRRLYYLNKSAAKSWKHCRYSTRDVNIYEDDHAGNVTSMVATGNILAIAYHNRLIMLWNIETLQKIAVLSGHHKAVLAMAFLSQDLLVTSSADATLKIWKIGSGNCLRTLIGHQGSVACVGCGAKIIVSGSQDKTVKVWSARSGRELATLIGHTAAVTSLQMVDRGQTAWSASSDRNIREWDMESFECVRVVVVAPVGIPVTSLSYSEGYLVCGCGPNVSIWRTDTCVRIETIVNSNERVTIVSLRCLRSVEQSKHFVVAWATREGRIRYAFIVNNEKTGSHVIHASPEPIASLCLHNASIIYSLATDKRSHPSPIKQVTFT